MGADPWPALPTHVRHGKETRLLSGVEAGASQDPQVGRRAFDLGTCAKVGRPRRAEKTLSGFWGVSMLEVQRHGIGRRRPGRKPERLQPQRIPGTPPLAPAPSHELRGQRRGIHRDDRPHHKQRIILGSFTTRGMQNRLASDVPNPLPTAGPSLPAHARH